MLLQDKVALITGAARGIGKAIALQFAKEGCHIAFTDIQLNDEVKQTIDELQSLGVTVAFYEGDVSDFELAHQIIEQVHEKFGKIDILVNNAGITRDTLLLRMSEKQWDDVIEVNLKSAFNYVHAVLPIMLRQRAGSIISLSSVVGIGGNAGQANYAASKAGIIALTSSISKEVSSRNIRVNAIAPGFIVTEMTKQLPENVLQDITNTIPMKRGGAPEEVAKVALFLASDLASYVNGQVIHVCGGMSH